MATDRSTGWVSPWADRRGGPTWVTSTAPRHALRRLGFWQQVAVDPPGSTDPHWRWIGGGDPPRAAAWQLVRGWLPAGMTVRPTCASTACIRPEHLEWWDPEHDF